VAVGYSSNGDAAEEVVQQIQEMNTGAQAFSLKANVAAEAAGSLESATA
jgi:hypothetical protein